MFEGEAVHPPVSSVGVVGAGMREQGEKNQFVISGLAEAREKGGQYANGVAKVWGENHPVAHLQQKRGSVGARNPLIKNVPPAGRYVH